MAPASKAPESASPTTTGPDGSVDNIAQAASALEANLTNLEGRLDALLAAFESAQEPNEDGTVAPPSQDAKKPDDTVPNKPSNGEAQSSESASSEAAKKA
ncbi:hypothetical protein BDP55DRAFT_735131 [Colletotrichum godetiae]|uniref:Uncharacterized protein n=1 Tax=Colletotrichum godetiae TaxID=1209918 RepID=A0AAJ0A661_9PEZI|nr:uncharacterized protein BDP55DRAFT_735131 [Colletotrichum godetiae]KAK1657185.1 hypothetical protein BDP55DRAFT_735131 [Colletotrichum godetiae]